LGVPNQITHPHIDAIRSTKAAECAFLCSLTHATITANTEVIIILISLCELHFDSNAAIAQILFDIIYSRFDLEFSIFSIIFSDALPNATSI
jgi:hypothetical protein